MLQTFRVFAKQEPQSCGTCRFSRCNGHGSLDCQRHAPTIGPEVSYRRAIWPVVTERGWCGDWQAAPK